ncbi:MAG: primosomal protein N' (replication factor Y) [Gammaproteobacteria bacterium]
MTIDIYVKQMHILNISLPVPLRRSFDYTAGDIPIDSLIPGMRILVPFGRQKQRVGILTKIANHTNVDTGKIKNIISVIDTQPVLSKSDLKLLQWTADYYHHPVGEVIFNALPAFLKLGKPATLKSSYCWALSESGKKIKPEVLKRAPRQLALLQLLASQPQPISLKEIESLHLHAGKSLLALQEKGLVEKTKITANLTLQASNSVNIKLNHEQKLASGQMLKALGKGEIFVLDGVTGSGKTEVYIEVMQSVIAQGKQVLVLSPEIGLTPQLVNRILSRINARITILHSGLSDSERLQAWLDAKNGFADIIIGTRSAIWTPLKNPGLFIVDEEHDLSYKQQEGLRYSARDIAVMRGSLTNSPVILGSATPSMESLHNVNLDKFKVLTLNKRAAQACKPKIEIIDLRNRAMEGAVSQVLLSAIKKEIDAKKQVMLFLNRRGYSPTIMCHHCGWIADCQRCDKHMTFHKQRNTLSCHHCDQQYPLPNNCPDCGAKQLLEIGHGTERLTETLTQCFPEARILRIDRDSTRRKGSMETMINTINAGQADILIGTQMLAKGHHFPNLTLVGIIDSDGGLCSSDFRASERMAQLFIQVSGRAGREKDEGTVMIQTHFPDHPLLNSLISEGYREFGKALLREREETNLPPFSYLALLRSEGHERSRQKDFLQKAADLLKHETRYLQIYGPIPAPIEKRAGKARMQLLVLSNNRVHLRQAMKSWSAAIEKLPDSKKVRWSLDIDPQDMM